MTHRIEKPTLLDETGIFHANTLATRLQELAGGPSGYRLRRIILTNFWLYTHQVIEIPHGRLFLAGDNGSGKSTVLTAAITLALDGDHRPERIDTFGKREKKIEYYILGGESNTPFHRDQRTSYLALEFEWCETQEPPFASELRDLWEKGEVEKARFLTIGLAFAGNKNNVKPITTIRFLITDGTRLGSDELSTFVNVPGEKPHVCDFKTFKKAVSLHGIVCERPADYEQKVAHYLFNFQKTEDLARLTRQLLYLRQPNLNSVLSLEKVRSYLDESLPELPFALIEHAAEMLDKMEDLKETTAKLKSAYDAAEKLDRAQKFATMAQARLSACESLYTLDLLEKKRKEVQRLERNIRRSERDLQNSKERVEILEKERSELEGKMSALENSEGMQLAQRLSETQDQLRRANEDLDGSQQALISATSRREETEEESENLSQTFWQHQKGTIQLLQTMQSRAETEARWMIASEQLLTTLERVKSLALDASLLDIPETLSSLEEYAIGQYLSWLETLKNLHTKLEQANRNLHSAREQEHKAFNTLDERTRQFESERAEVCAAQQYLADQLELLLEPTVWASLAPSSEQAALTWNASLLPSDSVPALEKTQQAYVEAIENIQKKIEREESALEKLLESAHKEQGAKEQEQERLQDAYQQKLQEQEFIPWRAPHRESARAYLAEEGIQALPFYMLIDFTEEIDSQAPLAGGIEQALADAGLLDALVVLPEQVEAMDACCLAQGLSDCRLDLHRLTDEPSFHLASLAVMRLLRVDPALCEYVGEKVPIWSETAQFLLARMQSAEATAEEDLRYWTHGLLTGTVGTGEARCIGKATRVRAQQEELARLREQEERLNQELVTLSENIAQNSQKKQKLLTLRKDLAALLPQSNLSELSATLQATLDNLHRADREYNQAKVAAQRSAEKLQEFRISLEKEAGRRALFAADPEEVEKAREAVTSLRSEYKTLIVYLQNVRNAWRGYQRAQQKLVQDSITERNATLAKQRNETNITRIKAELETLEQLAREAGDSHLMTLQKQLVSWKVRQSRLPQELIDANKEEGRAQGSLEKHREDYTEALRAQTQSEKQHDNRLQAFQALLSSYPVEMLIEIRQQREENKISPESLQKVLGEKFEADDDAYNTLKADLEKHAQTRRSELSQAFVNVSSTLHAYGPYFDEAEIVRFANAKDANAHELLTDLAEEIRFQELLLDTKERELFQDFLLKEMANTVGIRLTEAEAWIDRMNAILADSPFMDARYRLKWVARPHDPQRPGSHLALYRDVLRRQVETFNQEETEKLVDAFKQEIVIHQQAGSTANFTETLISILDYRRWFQFEIDMIHPNGSVQRLTKKFFSTGSGAEQYIELYIPFFTALSALYERAGKGAPRLIALDEAFDKVSTTNTRKLINFLAKQNFQWIMTGPRVTGEGTELPACVKYTMFCRKNEELAAGFPAFWSNNPAIAKEVQAGR